MPTPSSPYKREIRVDFIGWAGGCQLLSANFFLAPEATAGCHPRVDDQPKTAHSSLSRLGCHWLTMPPSVTSKWKSNHAGQVESRGAAVVRADLNRAGEWFLQSPRYPGGSGAPRHSAQQHQGVHLIGWPHLVPSSGLAPQGIAAAADDGPASGEVPQVCPLARCLARRGNVRNRQ